MWKTVQNGLKKPGRARLFVVGFFLTTGVLQQGDRLPYPIVRDSKKIPQIYPHFGYVHAFFGNPRTGWGYYFWIYMNLEYLKLFSFQVPQLFNLNEILHSFYIFLFIKEPAETLTPQILNIIWLMQEVIDLTAMTLTFIWDNKYLLNIELWKKIILVTAHISGIHINQLVFISRCFCLFRYFNSIFIRCYNFISP